MTCTIESFIKSLKHSPSTDPMFNPWYETDPENDQNFRGPQIRRRHLNLYLQQRLSSARYLLIAEAVGYQGAHFSGIAMTSERILLGHSRHKIIHPSQVFMRQCPQQTSSVEKWPRGLSEPTATIVWSSLLNFGIDPYSFVLWNAIPWHPYDPRHPKKLLSNRTPTLSELEYAVPFLQVFLNLFPNCMILAIGKKCASLLEKMRVDCHIARHPANGGAIQFRQHAQTFFQRHF